MQRLRLPFAFLLSIALLAGCATGAKKLVKQADREAQVGKYNKAIEYYQQALSDSSKVDSQYVLKQLAESYRLSNRLDSAAPYYKELVAKGKRDKNLFYLAQGMKLEGDYAKAKYYFEQYAAEGKDPKYVDWANLELEGIDKVKELSQKNTKLQVEGFEKLNTESDEFGPLLYEGQLIFASNRGEQKTFDGDGTGYLDLYKFTFDGADEASGAIQPFGEKINTPDAHEASATFTPDGRTVVFARSNTGKKGDRAEVDLYFSRYHNGEWSKPDLLPISDSASWDGTPMFSPDGKSLYFSSNRPGGMGGNDLYRAVLDERGRIRDVKNLGDEINTPGSEMFPYVSETGHLYFASDGHPGLGGLDLFRAERKDGVINIENIGKPVNSNRDDFGIAIISPIEGYFTSNRDGGKGGDDIYMFKEKDVVLKIANYFIEGEVEDEQERAMAGVNVEMRNLKGEVIQSAKTDEQGKFIFPVEIARNYVIYMDKGDEYFKAEQQFSTHGKAMGQEELEKDTTDVYLPFMSKMEKIELGKAIVLDNVYYDYDSPEIQETSLSELDKMITLMNDNPNLKVEISAHTDTRGSAEYNLKLSQARAESVVKYVIDGGIDAERLIAKGYGESKPIVENAETDQEHQRNRRTEFKVISK